VPMSISVASTKAGFFQNQPAENIHEILISSKIRKTKRKRL